MEEQNADSCRVEMHPINCTDGNKNVYVDFNKDSSVTYVFYNLDVSEDCMEEGTLNIKDQQDVKNFFLKVKNANWESAGYKQDANLFMRVQNKIAPQINCTLAEIDEHSIDGIRVEFKIKNDPLGRSVFVDFDEDSNSGDVRYAVFWQDNIVGDPAEYKFRCNEQEIKEFFKYCAFKVTQSSWETDAQARRKQKNYFE